MAVNSMTGFGRGEAEAGGVRVGVELSSVNRKQLDVRLNIPRSLATLEARVQKLIGAAVSRGSLTVMVSVVWTDGAKRQAVRLDMDKAAGYVAALREAGRALNLAGDLSLEALLRFPDVLVCEEAAQDSERVWPAVQKALQAALVQLQERRASEGRALALDLQKRFARLKKQAGQVAKLAPTVASAHRKALLLRIEAMQLADGPDADQIAREVALFADRSDISEELVRLNSHFDQVAELMERKEPVGRSLDFLCQGFLRAINTIGSKANDVRLGRLVVEMKAGQECIREQVQNIE